MANFLVEDAMKELGGRDVDKFKSQATIRVVGVGGAGCNVVTTLFNKKVKGAEIIALNTDASHLEYIAKADKKVLIGKDTTKGQGAGGITGVGRRAMEESKAEIREFIKGSDIVFVCAGMGGGTGTGAAPVVAQIAKDAGAIVICFVTMPFKIEKGRLETAEFGLTDLRGISHTVIVVDNNKLVDLAGSLPMGQAFAVADQIVAVTIQGISETINVPSLINLDFADVRSIFSSGDVATVGYGEASSEDRVKAAVSKALSSPLLDVSYEGATGALIDITGGSDLRLEEFNEIGKMITDKMDQSANVIIGARVDEKMEGRVRVITTITGVKSPYLLSKASPKSLARERSKKMGDDLGIEILERYSC